MAQLLVIQHVPHERLGTFEQAFRSCGLHLRTMDAADPKTAWRSLDGVAGLVVMGGPQSVYQQDRYPYLTKELAFLREAVKSNRPILGVCLGAQLLAAALGSVVTKSPQKEIGWFPLMREPGATGDPVFAAFGETETVFQWHGDTFALPRGAVRLASSPLCRDQAFRYRDHVWGLQFHVEVTEALIRAWMRHPTNRKELAGLQGEIDPMTIRRQSPQHIDRLRELAHHVATAFADVVNGSTARGTRARHIRLCSVPSPEHSRRARQPASRRT